MIDTHHEKKRILIVNVNWLGDVLFSTPFIRAVKERYQDSFIAVLLHPRCSQMLERNPRIDEIIIYDEEGVHRGILGKARLILSLRKKHFDIAFLLHRSFTKALMVYLAGIPERVGYATKGRAELLTRIAEEPAEEVHKVEYVLNILNALETGTRTIRQDEGYEFFSSAEDERSLQMILKQHTVAEGKPLLVIVPGGNWPPKRWPQENFAALADALIEKYQAALVIACARKDASLASEIRARMKHQPIVLCGELTLSQLGALLKRADLVIANDTGPMHIAAAVKTRVIALFGPTSPKITGPYGKGDYRVLFKNTECAVPCYEVTCPDNRCMRMILVDDVIRAADELLQDAIPTRRS